MSAATVKLKMTGGTNDPMYVDSDGSPGPKQEPLPAAVPAAEGGKARMGDPLKVPPRTTSARERKATDKFEPEVKKPAPPPKPAPAPPPSAGGAAVGSKAVDSKAVEKRHRGANGQPMNYKPREKKSKVEQTFTNQTVDVSGEGAPVLLPSIKGEPSPTRFQTLAPSPLL